MSAAPAPPSLSAHLRKLFAHSAAYGAADVLTNVVNFALTPLYFAHLTLADYGHLALLFLWGTVAKILFRLGLDAGFFRIHYDMESKEDARRLAGTVLVFSALAATTLLALVVALRGPLTALVLQDDAPSRLWVVLVAADVFVGSFAFVPLSLLRIEDRPGLFSAYSVFRHLLNTVLKVVLVLRGWGVEGILWSDLAATTAFALALLPLLRGRVQVGLDWNLLRRVLAFALPKVPHGVMVQTLNLGDRKILDHYAPRAEVGLYQVGYMFGAGVKFALSAFEPAWSPFVYARFRDPDGPQTLARVALVVFALFAFAALGMAVLGDELLTVMSRRNPEFRAAAPVIPVVAFAYLLHGLFLLTSVGIGIARRAAYYPAITAAAAAANIGLNLALVPRVGMMGAAWATVAGYGVMALVGAVASRRAFFIPFAWPRFFALGALAVVLTGLSSFAPAALLPGLAAQLLLLLLYPVCVFAFSLAGESPWLHLREAADRGRGREL